MPFKSEAQRRYFNANRKKLESQGVDVDEWNDSSRGKKLPEKVKAASTVACLAQALAKQARCWQGYEPVPGKVPYSEDSCRPVGSKKKKEKKADDFGGIALPLGVVGLGATLGGLGGRYLASDKDKKGKPQSRLGPTLAGAALGGLTASKLVRFGVMPAVAKVKQEKQDEILKKQMMDYQQAQEDKIRALLESMKQSGLESKQRSLELKPIRPLDHDPFAPDYLGNSILGKQSIDMTHPGTAAGLGAILGGLGGLTVTQDKDKNPGKKRLKNMLVGGLAGGSLGYGLGYGLNKMTTRPSSDSVLPAASVSTGSKDHYDVPIESDSINKKTLLEKLHNIKEEQKQHSANYYITQGMSNPEIAPYHKRQLRQLQQKAEFLSNIPGDYNGVYGVNSKTYTLPDAYHAEQLRKILTGKNALTPGTDLTALRDRMLTRLKHGLQLRDWINSDFDTTADIARLSIPNRDGRAFMRNEVWNAEDAIHFLHHLPFDYKGRMGFNPPITPRHYWHPKRLFLDTILKDHDMP